MSDAPLKQCRKCKRWLPEDKSHFYVNSKTQCLTSPCKECRGNAFSKPSQTDKRCTKCGVAFPYTEEYFRLRKLRKKHILVACCRACENKAGHEHIIRPDVRKARREYKRRKRNENPEAHRDYIKRVLEKDPDYYKNRHLRHPDRARVSLLNRRARKQSLPDTLTSDDWQNALSYFGGCCAVCGRSIPSDTHSAAADHWIPMITGGGTTPDNIVPLCHSRKGQTGGCNNRKFTLSPTEFLEREFPKQAPVILARIEAYFASL